MDESPIALGTMNFGTKLDEAASVAILDRFVERGGRWLDTANCYAFWNDPAGVGGHSESLLGRWLAARPGVRERIRISTKMRQQPTEPGNWPDSAEGLSATAISNAVKQSLTRLGVDRIDLYWAHAQDTTVDLAETVAAFGALTTDGVVERLGASNHATWRVERARSLAAVQGVAGYTALQLRHSYLQPRPSMELLDHSGQIQVSSETFDYLSSEDELDLWVYTPLLNGAYSKPERLEERWRHPATTARLAVLREVAAELGVTANQVVLAWLRHGDIAAKPIVGVSTIEQLDEAMDHAQLRLSAEHCRRLDEPR